MSANFLYFLEIFFLYLTVDVFSCAIHTQRDTDTHTHQHRHNVWQVHRFLGRLFCGSFNKIIANGRRKTESHKLQRIVGKKRRVVKKNAVSPPYTHTLTQAHYTRTPTHVFVVVASRFLFWFDTLFMSVYEAWANPHFRDIRSRFCI